jgi:hypothetical protein
MQTLTDFRRHGFDYQRFFIAMDSAEQFNIQLRSSVRNPVWLQLDGYLVVPSVLAPGAAGDAYFLRFNQGHFAPHSDNNLAIDGTPLPIVDRQDNMFHWFDRPEVISTHMKKEIHTFSMRLVDSTGAAAPIARALFWFTAVTQPARNDLHKRTTHAATLPYQYAGDAGLYSHFQPEYVNAARHSTPMSKTIHRTVRYPK